MATLGLQFALKEDLKATEIEVIILFNFCRYAIIFIPHHALRNINP